MAPMLPNLKSLLILLVWLSPLCSSWTFPTPQSPTAVPWRRKKTVPRRRRFVERISRCDALQRGEHHGNEGVTSVQCTGIGPQHHGSSSEGHRLCRRRRNWRSVTVAALVVVASLLVAPRTAMASLATSPNLAAATVAEAPVIAATTTTTLQCLPTPIPKMMELQLTLRLLFASLFGAAVGQERSMTHKHSAGVRTMALVALGACAFTVCSLFGFNAVAVGKCDPSRMASNVASGVGFVGAGVITTSTGANPNDSRQSIVHGLTTATAIWISAAIGVACGVGMFYIAAAATLSTITILKFGGFKKKWRKIKKKAAAAAAAAEKESSQQQQQQPLRIVSTKELPLLKSKSVSLEEMNDTDDWDSHVESVDEDEEEVEDEEEEEVEATSKNEMVLPTKEKLTPELDQLIEAYHQGGLTEILEQAHVASMGKNLTGLLSSKGGGSESRRRHKDKDEDFSLQRLEPRRTISLSTTRGNETFLP